MMAAADPLPAGWRDAAPARDLVCWRDAQLRALAQALDHALAPWSAGWGLPPAQAVACQAAAPLLVDLPWRRLDRGTEAAGWLHVPAETADSLRGLLFAGATANSRVARSAALECEQDARRRLLAALGLTVSAAPDPGPSDADAGGWSGAVEVRLPAPLNWCFLLHAAAMAAWCREHGSASAGRGPLPAPPLASVIEAVAALPVKLAVQLAGCELELGSLQRLQPGDVLRMEHRIDAPATVRDGAGTPLFRAYLGRRDDARAVELAPLDGHAVRPATQEGQP